MGTPITIDELAQKAGVSPVSLLERDMCTDEDLLALARFCDSWELTGHYLKLSERELSAVDEENKTVELKRVGILKKWRRKKAFYATYRAFIDVFLEQGDALTAYKICQEFQKHYCQSEAQTATAAGASQPSPSLAQSDSGYGSQLNLLSQQSGAAIADEDADTASYKLTPQLSVEPPKDGHFNGVDEMDSNPPINDQSASSPPLRSVDPLFPPTDNPQILRDRDRILSDALKTFKLKSFLPNQESTIRNILSGTSTLLIQRVGFGKSLCYQLPAYLYSQSESHASCITLVISPLISLMEDQMRNCPKELNVRCLHTNQSKQQKAEVLRELRNGNVSVLLLSPETLESGSFRDELGIPHLLGRLRPIIFACIDEAHCISEWSHNFRPSYFRIQKILREHLGVHCVLGLTATATHTTALSVANYLGIKEENIIVGDSILPKNLHISVSQVSSKYSERDKALIDLLQSSNFRECGSIIIYCTTCNQTDKLANKLSDHFKSFPENESDKLEPDQNEALRVTDVSVKRKKSTPDVSSKRQKTDCCVASYHGRMLPIDRKRVQDDFMEGRIRIIVVTVAFSMGLNKTDVRAIIHYNMPKSIELYVQEIGRAGRDGKPAYCHAFIDEKKQDFYFLRRFAYENSMDPGALEHFLEKMSSSQCTQQSLHFLLSQPSQGLTGDNSSQQIIISSKEMEKLDIKEDCTFTLLCYLELEGWLEITNAIYDTCTIKWGDDPKRLKVLEKEFSIVAAAAAKLRENGHSLDYTTEMKFSVSELANYMEKKFDEVYSELRSLKNNDQETIEQKGNEIANTMLVEFSGQIFSIQSSKDFSQEERCDIYAYLKNKMKIQEKSVVKKLHLLHAVLQSIIPQNSHSVEPLTIRNLTDRYFSKEGLNMAYFREHNIPVVPLEPQIKCVQKGGIKNDVQSFLRLFKHTSSPFTGTAIARIFYGIGSPLFPYDIWKKQIGFWGNYDRMDFNELREIATSKLQ